MWGFEVHQDKTDAHHVWRRVYKIAYRDAGCGDGTWSWDLMARAWSGHWAWKLGFEPSADVGDYDLLSGACPACAGGLLRLADGDHCVECGCYSPN